MALPLLGACLCGAVRYRVSGTMRDVVMCHCTQCRKSTGHYLAATAARRKDFELLSSGTLAWYRSSAQARRGFCAACGSTLFWDADGRDTISIAAGSLDGPTGLRTGCHIFVGNKGDYYDFDDHTPKIADGAFSPDFPA